MSKEHKKKTIGEELWLIHLKRYHPTPEDLDTPPPKSRTRSKSIGEELYEVHLKRCKGLCFDTDTDKSDEGKFDDVPSPDHLSPFKLIQEPPLSMHREVAKKGIISDSSKE